MGAWGPGLYADDVAEDHRTFWPVADDQLRPRGIDYLYQGRRSAGA